MSNNAASALQMIDWRIADFKATNTILNPSTEIPHIWTIQAHIDQLDPDGDVLRSVLSVHFTFRAQQDDGNILFEGTATSYFVFDTAKIEVDNPPEFFNHLLHGSAMSNMLGNLRIFLVQISALLQTGSKRVILPFINLNDFHFDEEYSFTI